MLKCPECETILKVIVEDEINVVRCSKCSLVWRGPINLEDMEVNHEIVDALSDVYIG